MAQAAVIEPEPGQGWRFSSLLTNSRADLYGYRFRMAIEPAAIADPDFIFDADAFRDCRLEQEAVAREASGFSPLMLFDMGVRFHETLAGCCANPFFLDALRRLNRRRRFIVHKVLLEPDRARRQAIEHLRLLDLLDQGRMSDAVKLLRRHLDENSDSKRGSRSHVHF
jgi:DNA-binding GntR family transcriptional regulator